jgi:hypothetical protein
MLGRGRCRSGARRRSGATAASRVNRAVMRGVIPAFRNGRTFQKFGRELLRWGTGPRGARVRLRELTADDLAGVSGTHALAVIHFYHHEYRRNPGNRTARHRMALGIRALELIAASFRRKVDPSVRGQYQVEASEPDLTAPFAANPFFPAIGELFSPILRE